MSRVRLRVAMPVVIFALLDVFRALKSENTVSYELRKQVQVILMKVG